MVARFADLAEARRTTRPCSASACPAPSSPTAEPLPPSGVLFLLLALPSVSFDGLSRTFFWLGLNGVNPLEFPGRSAMIGSNTAGLACGLPRAVPRAVLPRGRRSASGCAGDGGRSGEAAGLYVWSIVPIALAYHFAHYLTALLVNGQYALVALVRPVRAGLEPVRHRRHARVSAGIVSGSALGLGHVEPAGRGDHRRPRARRAGRASASPTGCIPSAPAALLSQLPLTLLMVAYTVFGLWLLSTPTAG